MNRAVLLALGGVAVLVVVAGGLVGAGVLGGSADGPSTPTAVPIQDPPPMPTTQDRAPTATAGPTDAARSTPTRSGTAVASPTPTELITPRPSPTPDPTVPPEAFNRTAIERAVVELVNENRAAANLTRLDADGTYGDRLRWMARNHSVAMADVGAAVPEIDGETSADRYEDAGLYYACRWTSESGSLVRADGNALEVVGTTTAGQPYRTEGGERLNANETMVARALVEGWEGSFYEDRLDRPGATEIGVGVHVHWNGEVYATVALCG